MNDKCDKCDNMARITVTGAISPHRVLCAFHCAQLCQENNDQAGYEKFMALTAGDRKVA